jgi:hypothetical protein
VTNWGKLGRWAAFHVCHDPQALGGELAYTAQQHTAAPA